ncbi:MAG: glycosyltransferase family 9 protein [Acidobacteria bacterium]|nr:glycosyltransferase family 9 protein [Acidobacteriota bacterium]
MKTKPKILAYLFGSLGDSIVAIPSLRAMRRQFPEAEIVMLQDTHGGNIVRASEVIPDGLVDRYMEYESSIGGSGKFSIFRNLLPLVRRERFDAAVYLVISERPARAVLRDKIFFRLCGIRKLYGFRSFTQNELYPIDADGRPAITPHEAIRKLERLAPDGITTDTDHDLAIPWMMFSREEEKPVDEWLAERTKPGVEKPIAIAPGCKTLANQWPAERFIEISKRIVHETGRDIMIVGGKGEREFGERIIAECGSGVNATGEFSVRGSAILLSKCDLLIGLDTGTTHLAAAVGTRCLGIYGERNNPGHWYPFGGGHTVIGHKVECAGCRFLDCPISEHPCMKEVNVETVWQEVERLLSSSPTPDTAGVPRVIYT